MLMTKWMRRAGAYACTAALLATPAATFAETPIATAETKAEAKATDVVLGPKGRLLGLVKDMAGKATGHALVTVGYSGSEVAAVESAAIPAEEAEPAVAEIIAPDSTESPVAEEEPTTTEAAVVESTETPQVEEEPAIPEPHAEESSDEPTEA